MVKSKAESKSKASVKRRANKEAKIRSQLIDKDLIENDNDFQLTDQNVAIAYTDKEGNIDRTAKSDIGKLDDDKFQVNVITGEDRDVGRQYTIFDAQRVSKYTPETKLVKIEAQETGAITVDEYSKNGERLSSLAVISSDLDFEAEHLNTLNQGELRRFVVENNLTQDIPKFNSLSNKQLRIQIVKAMNERDSEVQTMVLSKDSLFEREGKSGNSYDFVNHGSKNKPMVISIKDKDGYYLETNDATDMQELKKGIASDLDIDDSEFEIDLEVGL